MAVGLWDWPDVAQEEQWWAPRFFRLLGYQPGDLTPSRSVFRALVHPEDRETTFAGLHDTVETGAPFHVEHRLRCNNGSFRWFLGTGQASRQTPDSPRRMVGTIMDIDDLKQVQSDLEKRTHALESAIQDLDRFAYIASHDLRTPLRGIDNLSLWLEEDLGPRIDAESREKLKLMRNRVQRMENLLADILAYSRIGRRESAPEDVDCDLLVRTIASDMALPEEFTVEIPEPLPVFRFSRTLIQQALTNLLNNAIKHNDRHRGRIIVRCRQSAGHLQITVEDDGPGIAQQFHERVFQMFQTLESRDKTDGTGIGLAIVQKVVGMAGGRVWVESPLTDRGTAFHMVFPVPSDETLENSDGDARQACLAAAG